MLYEPICGRAKTSPVLSFGSKISSAIMSFSLQLAPWIIELCFFDDELKDNFKKVYASVNKIKENLKLMWLSCGKEDGLYDASTEFVKLLDEKGIENESLFSEGGHTWMNCRLYLSTIAPKLFK